MMADLDHFKQVNDRFGHAAGDAVLMETARRLRSQMRTEDVLARVGGEEFMMVLPNTTRPQALEMADRLCQRINRELFRIPGQKTPIPITTSIGLFAIDGQCLTTPFLRQDVPSLLAQADRALYEAKGAGRNQVSLIAAAA